MEKDLEAVRRLGYASSYGERDPEVAALAAPIYSHEGNVCAALSIAGPINRFFPEHNVRHVKILGSSAERLPRMLGYHAENLGRSKTSKMR